MKTTFSIGACGAVLLFLLLLSSCASYEAPHERVAREVDEAAAHAYAVMRAAGKPIAYGNRRLGTDGKRYLVGKRDFSLTEFANLSDKTIKYFTIKIYLYSRVGDKTYDSIGGKHIVSVRKTGPIYPFDQVPVRDPYSMASLRHDYVGGSFYTNGELGECRYSGTIKYMDGSSRSFTHEEFLSWEFWGTRDECGGK